MSNPEGRDQDASASAKQRRFGQGTLHQVFDRMITELRHQPSLIQQEQEQQAQETEEQDGEA